MSDNSLDIQTKYSSFMGIIENSIRCCTPSKRPLASRSPRSDLGITASPWWDEECERFCKLRKAAFLKFKLFSLRENFLKYKQVDAIAKSHFKKRKRSYFLDFCGSLTRFSNLKIIWQKIRAMGNKFHRDETANVYNKNSSRIIFNQIDKLCKAPQCEIKIARK